MLGSACQAQIHSKDYWNRKDITVANARERKKIRIGDLLIQNQLITDEQLSEALASQKQSG